MEVGFSNSMRSSVDHDDRKGGGPLPGFRFHPTDEELVGFYLRRKVENMNSIRFEQLIKHADIYKYDPWDLPKTSITVGDSEWYFFCKRGRKYRNSVRPNRVTGSGFWKATGIDRPVYSAGRDCIGLKKSLVFYRGSAGKGTKTDWMMHEFRLPPAAQHKAGSKPLEGADQDDAEVWTLCRILKRRVSEKRPCIAMGCSSSRSKPIKTDKYSCNENWPSNYINFSMTATDQPNLTHNQDKKPYFSHMNTSQNQQYYSGACFLTTATPQPTSATAASSVASTLSYVDIDEFSRHGHWEDLWSTDVDHSFAPPAYATAFST